ncbi:hypothetical protein SO802_002517 [Lithocarpus litseifolius]|uniref:RNase H type-1 domain-containing protein n=1 Tax=Lithocarpus litseifolius TaxID=425828 RepID=A0AAW2E0Z4_9ROSI
MVCFRTIPVFRLIRTKASTMGALVIGASKTRASIGICTAQPRKTVSPEPSRTGSSEPCLTLLGPWCLTSPLARKLILVGAKWRIGDGCTTWIYKDAWLPSEGAGLVVSSTSFLHKESVISDLIDVDSKWWNSQLIDQLFFPFEAQKFKSIPLCLSPQPDVLCWANSSSELYTVKTGGSRLSPDLFAIICWLNCQRRNKTRVWEPILPLTNIAATARDNLREFQSLQHKPHDTPRPRRKVWKPPDTNTCKTNFDRTMFEDLNKAGIGVVVRNSKGEVMAAMSEKIIMPPSVFILETIAIRRAVHLIHELFLPSSMFEGDSKVSIKALQ